MLLYWKPNFSPRILYPADVCCSNMDLENGQALKAWFPGWSSWELMGTLRSGAEWRLQAPGSVLLKGTVGYLPFSFLCSGPEVKDFVLVCHLLPAIKCCLGQHHRPQSDGANHPGMETTKTGNQNKPFCFLSYQRYFVTEMENWITKGTIKTFLDKRKLREFFIISSPLKETLKFFRWMKRTEKQVTEMASTWVNITAPFQFL